MPVARSARSNERNGRLQAFDDEDTYGRGRPSAAYFQRLLGGDSFIALVALVGTEAVGGLAAYDVHEFEQERSEIYIYDLASSVGAPARGHRYVIDPPVEKT